MRKSDFVPPILYKMISEYSNFGSSYGWSGNYKSWQDALKDSSGYDSMSIVEKVKEALLKVKKGEAVYERDSVLFDKIEYSWPLLAGLLWVASHDGRLNVLDFGGSLGSSYFQNLKFLNKVKDFRWNVVEQGIFVKYGREYFEDEALSFYDDASQCYQHQKPNVVLFSCVLQYMEKPYQTLESVFKFSPEYIIVDNMPFIETEQRITLQRVPPSIYSASYPCWMLNKTEFLGFFQNDYDIIADFISPLSIKVDSKIIPYQGFIFKKTQNSVAK